MTESLNNNNKTYRNRFIIKYHRHEMNFSLITSRIFTLFNTHTNALFSHFSTSFLNIFFPLINFIAKKTHTNNSIDLEKLIFETHLENFGDLDGFEFWFEWICFENKNYTANLRVFLCFFFFYRRMNHTWNPLSFLSEKNRTRCECVNRRKKQRRRTSDSLTSLMTGMKNATSKREKQLLLLFFCCCSDIPCTLVHRN